MALNKTNHGERKAAEHMTGTTAYSMPTVYVGLFTSDPGETGSQAGEVVGGSYARQLYGGVWDAGSSYIKNSAIIRFDAMPSSTVTHVGLLDASSSGNMIYYGPLTSSVTVPATYPFEFAAGALTVEEF